MYLYIVRFLKHFLGHDLTRVTMPVHINEPLSFTQRIVEDLEYSDLLHKAAGGHARCRVNVYGRALRGHVVNLFNFVHKSPHVVCTVGVE